MRAGPSLREWNVPLRVWQHEGVSWWSRALPTSALAVATPGGGKTIFAAAVGYGALKSGLIERIIFVVPSDHLRTQVALSFSRAGIEIDPYFTNGRKAIPRDLYGAVVTYQQVALAPERWAELTVGSRIAPRRTMVILDEIHHAGDDARWGESVERAFSGATYIVAMSGTPFRSDKSRVKFLRYDEDGRVLADIHYGYREALVDGAVRPVVFHRQGGEVDFVDEAGRHITLSFDDEVDDRTQRKRLRAALRDGAWVSEVIRRGSATLGGMRKRDHRAGGIAIAIDEAHARWIASQFGAVTGKYPDVVVHTDVEAGAKIKAFANGDSEWLVAVRMVSEGVDIPRLRALLYLTTARTEMYFRQIVGRVVRGVDPAYVLVPDDPVLSTWAAMIETDVHAVPRVAQDVAKTVASSEPARPEEVVAGGEADADDGLVGGWRVDEVRHVDAGEYVGPMASAALRGQRRVVPVTVVQEPIPVPRRAAPNLAPMRETSVVESRDLQADVTREIRAQVNGLVRQVAAHFKKEPRDVWRLLRRRDGSGVSDATADQLRRRKASLELWLRENFYPG